MRRLLLILPALVLGLASCGQGGPGGQGGERGEPGGEDAPPRGAELAPDAFCVEHGVLEAVCTTCNPKLAVIFQQKGDWCAEHGFPESFCPICRPELGGRPAVDLGGDGAPLDGTRVVLRTPEAVQAAGIEVAEARAPEAESTLTTLSSIAYDAPRRAEVNARMPGVVRDVLVDIGAQVTRGAPLLRIESAEVGAELSHLAAARARLRVAELGQERVKGLFDTGMAARKEMLEAELELETARAEIAAGTAALGLVDVEEGAENRYVLLAPIDGVVVRVAVVAGRMVAAADTLCEIVDTSVMWAELDVPEAELGRVRAGQQVRVQVEALGERAFEGMIDFVAPEVDPRTRTTTARVRLANPEGTLRAGMFASATIRLGPSSARALVPLDALQRAGDVQLIFVQLAADRYEARRVKVGARRGQQVEILAGVEPGERVATRGSFLLKTETLRGSIGAGCCEVE